MRNKPVLFYVQCVIISIYYILGIIFIVSDYFKPFFKDEQRIGFGALLLVYALFRSVMMYQKYFRRNAHENI